MNKFLVTAACFGMMTTTALAADLPSRRAPPVYIPPPIPVFTWTGAYIGANAGYAFEQDHNIAFTGNTAGPAGNIATGLRPAFLQDRAKGFTGGGQFGYNYQITGAGGSFGGLGGVVIGIEADAAYTGNSEGSFYTAGAFSSQAVSKTDFVGTVRGRLGYAFDRFLVYGTGGFAYGNVSDNIAFYNAAGVNTYFGSQNTLRTGYAYGGGVEYAIPVASFLNPFHSSAVTVKAEFIHYDLNSNNVLVASTAGTGNSFNAAIHAQGNLVRAGVNYKFDFGGAPAPVVARY